jgi:hypothetical protein
MFACHIAGFEDMGDGITEITSAKFALPFPTLIELSSFTAKARNGRVELEWVTESEIDNAGFNVYRAEAENRDYIQINDALIIANGSASQGAAYEFVDSNVRNRKTYYYKLQDIDLNSATAMHGPVSATPRFILGIVE